MITRNNAVKLLKKVISINSMNPHLTDTDNNENELAEFLGNYLADLGMKVSYQEQEGRKNIIATLKGGKNGKRLILNAHTDTVGEEGMPEPLSPREENGRIHGRGSYDMKGGLVSCILALESIIEQGINLSGDVIFAGVVDEEYGSIGTEMLVREYQADAAIICEPTDERIVIANKGFSWLKMIVHGKAAHGSKPHLGIDAIDKSRKVLNAVHDLQKQLNQKIHDLVGAPTIRVTKIEGGLGLSTIPDKCILYFERRTLPHRTQSDIQQEMEQLITNLSEEDPDFSAEFELIIFRGGLELSREEPIVQELSGAYRQIMGQEPTYSGEPWWMDSALMGEHGIPTVVIGPKGEGAHAKVEFVEVDSVVKIGEMIEKTIIAFCD